MLRVVGGANVPTQSMRIAASWPLAVLSLDGTELTLRLRTPGFLDAQDLCATPSTVTLVSPLSHRPLIGRRGIGVTLNDGREFYFLSGKVETILNALAAAGYAVEWQERPPRKAWRAEP